jgi:hypothetical protein
MDKQQGVIQIILPLIVLLMAISILGIFLYQKQSTGLSNNSWAEATHPYSSFTPSLPPSEILTASPKPSESSVCNCSWAISTNTNVDFLVTNPSGQQEGYLKSSNSYARNIPDAYYGIELGIGDEDSGGGPLQPDILQFGQKNPENGIYTLQVIGKTPGKYHIDMAFAWGSGNTKTTSIDGMLTTNQTDIYTVTIPNGTIQKIDK